jgi:hypothetical protein
MAKRRRRRGKRGHGAGASKEARKKNIGKMSLGCLILLLLGAIFLIVPRVLTGGG